LNITTCVGVVAVSDIDTCWTRHRFEVSVLHILKQLMDVSLTISTNSLKR